MENASRARDDDGLMLIMMIMVVTMINGALRKFVRYFS